MVVQDASDKSFDQMIQGEYAVAEFFGDHCGGCVILAPVFQETASQMPFIDFIRINVSHNPETAERYDINSLPTLCFFRKGQVVHRTIGSMDRQTLNHHISKMLYE